MEDHEIVDLYWARDERALTETAAKFGAYCRKIALRLLGSAPDAEEVENDTWLAAWNSMPENRPVRLAPYLGRITRNLALDRWDAAQAQKRGGGQAPLILDELAACLPAGDSPQGRAEAAELGRAVSDFLRTQKPGARTAFLRRYWYGDSLEDIARRYGYTAAKVKSLLHRTRKGLREHLIREGYAL